MFKKSQPLAPERKAILDKAYDVQNKVLHILEGREELEGVGIAPTQEGYAVKVNLSEPLPKNISLPDKLEGVPVYIQYVGRAIAY